MSAFDSLPEGKIVVLAPETAAKLFDQAPPEMRNRIFAGKDIPIDKAYVIDTDKLRNPLDLLRRDLWRVGE